MRNLKKILALVLALVMSLSLMATAGASQFPDVDEGNPYATAIDVLDELKVFQGFDDGTFKPTETLNRAQAAVLVYRIATGDVENKYLDNYTFMQQSKFTDLDGYNWAKGYINYCQNAGIVVGTSATTFDPGAKVTGYQLLVMLLRTLGYGKAGEFADPKGWELQTAAIAEREGITKNVTAGDFGAPAPRQMVAEILFRGLLHDTVEYSALTPGGYTNSGETLGKKNLGLEDIKGVVMANEFADLEDDSTLADGKTRLDVDGKVYNLDIKSELTDIGEIRHAYVQNGTKVLTTLENLNDSVVNQPENGKASKVSDLSKVNGDTQYFKNFEPLESNTSEWRIEFNVEFVDNAALNITKEKAKADFEAAYGDVDYLKSVGNSEYKFTKSIKAGNEITPADLQIIKGIFDWADGEDINGADADINDGIKGSVYVGANSESSSNRNKNLAVEMTYKQFKAEYIDGTYTTISSSDNGEWLKTIDNNGDGVADYVFRTDFVMSVIADCNTKNETYYVEFDGETKRNVNSSIEKSAVVTEDELAVGDVILYTWIDGKCYVSHPEVDTAAIDKKGIDYKAKTITCGDTTYDWSGIEQEAYHYYHDVSEANVEVNYSLYKDHFGYVRLFAEANKGFVLLTDGFYATDLKKEHTYKAEIWDEAAKELAEVAVANDAFIDTDIDTGGKREEGTWDRLEAFEESYPAHVDGDLGLEYITTVASFDVNADGVYNLAEVESYSNRFAYTQHELDIASFDKGSVKDKDLKVTANHLDKNGNSADSRDLNRINATDETVYYYVQYKDSDKRDHNEIVDVTTWTGYKEGSVKLVDGDRAYAVTRAYREADNSDWVNYETAEIIVIEHKVTGKTNVVFPVTLTQRLIGTRNEIGGNGFVWGDESGKWGLDEFTGRYKAQVSETVKSVDSNNIAPVDISDLLHFYKKESNGELTRIDGNFAEHNIYAGVIVTEIGTVSRSYGEIGLARGSADLDPDDIAPKHDFYKASDNFYTIGYDRDSATEKDEMLHIPGHQYDWLYGDVSSTFEANGLDAADMNRGDLVLYVTDGDGAVQAVINVTESRMDKSYDSSTADGSFPGVYRGDDHTTSSWNGKYNSTYSLLSLWRDIADDQGTVVPADAPVVKFYGVEDNQAGDTDSTVGTITVSHATAKAATNANFLTVEGGKWTITPDAPESTDAVSTSAQTWTLSIYGDDEQWYTYTLVLDAQSELGDLISKDISKLQVSGGVAPNYAFTVLKFEDKDSLTPESVEQLLTTTRGADVTLVAKDALGNEIAKDQLKDAVTYEITLNLDGRTYGPIIATVAGSTISGTFYTLTLDAGTEVYDSKGVDTLEDVANKNPLPVKVVGGLRQVIVDGTKAYWLTHAGTGRFTGIGGGDYTSNPNTPAWVVDEGYTLWGQTSFAGNVTITFTEAAPVDATITGVTLSDARARLDGAKIENLDIMDPSAATMDLTLPLGTDMTLNKFSDYRWFDLETWFGTGDGLASGLTGSRPLNDGNNWNGNDAMEVSPGTALDGYTAQFVVTVKGANGGADATLTVNVKERDTASYYLYFQGGKNNAANESGNINIAFYDVGEGAWVGANELPALAASADIQLALGGKNVTLTNLNTLTPNAQISPKPGTYVGEYAYGAKFNMAKSQFTDDVICTYLDGKLQSGSTRLDVDSDAIDIVNFSATLAFDFS